VTGPGDADCPAPSRDRDLDDPGASGSIGRPGYDEHDQYARLTAWVRGRVQGVGFRWWVRRNALELGLRGLAENLIDGRVRIIAEGERDGLLELLGRLEGPGAPGHVAQVTHRWDEIRGGFSGFVEL
jgi:acylphosphatase